MADHLVEVLLPDLVLQQSLAILGEDGLVEGRLDQVHIQEPPELLSPGRGAAGFRWVRAGVENDDPEMATARARQFALFGPAVAHTSS